MRETDFIRQNKDKWSRFERVLASKQKDPDELSSLFIQVTDDLSYSRTHYTNRSVRVYLNNIAQSIYYNIYKNKKLDIKKIPRFWKEELPYVLYHSRKALLFSFVFFLIAVLIGIISTENQADFPRIILGDQYVDMTIENIKKGDPMSVYKQSDELSMTLGIALNNIRIAFMTFVLGIFASFGTLYILLRNGIMLGSFQYFFHQHDVLYESVLTIWIHGTLEISAIIIAGAAGLVMGNGLLFPGTYSRLQSFQRSARNGLKIMLGITPIFALAAILEGFVTRHTDAPDILRLAIIILSLLFVLAYYVWYPLMKARQGFKYRPPENRISPDKPVTFDMGKIKSAGEILVDVFTFYKKYFSKLMRLMFVVALAFGIVAPLFLQYDHLQVVYNVTSVFYWLISNFFNKDFASNYFFNFSAHPLQLIIVTMATAVLMVFVSRWSETLNGKDQSGQHFFYPAKWLPYLLISFGLYAVFYLAAELSGALLFLAFLILTPLALLIAAGANYKKLSAMKGIQLALSHAKNSIGDLLGVFFSILLINLVIFLLLTSSFTFLFYDFFEWVTISQAQGPSYFVTFCFAFVTMFEFLLLFSFHIIGMQFLLYSIAEKNEASALVERINKIGTQKKVFS